MYADESSISLTPFVSTTYAPVGQSPSIRISTEISKRIYLAGAVSPQGDLIYMIRKKPFDGAAIVEYLTFLTKQIKSKLLLIWDNASIHDCQTTRAYLSSRNDESLFLVKQPKYSPELNASELVWAYLKGVILKNNCNRNIKELSAKVLKGMETIKNQPQLIRNFFKHPQLGFL